MISSTASLPLPALIIIAVVGLFLAAMLQSIEVAFSRMSIARATDLVEEERQNASTLLTLLDHRRRATLVLRGFRTFFQVIVAVSLTLAFSSMSLAWWATALVALLAITFVHFVFISLVPSRWGQRSPEKIALSGAPLVSSLVTLTRFLDPLVETIRGRLPASDLTEAEARAEMANDLREMVDQVGETEGLEDEDREMLRSVLDLGHTLVREVMVPRTEMVTAPADLPAHKALRLFVRSGFSRIPVEGDDVDDIRGILYFKDVVARLQTYGADMDQVAEQMMRPVEFTVEMKPADDLLRLMQADHFHMAIVIDEYGGVAGLVTLEDLIEEVVGDLTDEHDKGIIEPEQRDDGSWRVPARYPITELGELFDLELEDDDVDSVGGLLAKALGRVPLPGAQGDALGIHMLAEEARGRRRQVGTIVCSLLVASDESTEETSEDA